MADAVENFDQGPQPRQSNCNAPTASHRPKEAPYTEGEERHIEENKPALEIGRYEAGEKVRWRGRLPQIPAGFPDGMSCLGENESAERELEARHNCRLTNWLTASAVLVCRGDDARHLVAVER